ncbi:MAG: FAD-linked oxidase C-terminal domain-containing protein, partial [Acidimicrobiales bacterium]
MSPAPSAPRLALLEGELLARLGPGRVLTDPAELRTYECDGLAAYRAVPGLVVLCESAEEISLVVGCCHNHRVPFVARGSGTGLSGGALPRTDGVLVVTSRMSAVLEIDVENERAVVEPGVANLAVSRAASAHGLHYAPDPSSQQVCSIGGNVAENSGGAHCLKYGFTVHHVTGLEIVLPDGTLVDLGGKSEDPPGYDLVGAFVGSEGTLGIATRVTVRLLRDAEAVETLLAAFPTMEEASAAVSDIVASGCVPAAIEMMDALAIEAAEAAVHSGYPAGAGAVLIVEIDGPRAEVEVTFEAVSALCGRNGAFEIRVAADEAERAAIWKGRKSAFAAVGRISPDYIVQDGVVPRSVLGEVLHEIGELAGAAGLRVANVFHAGDGNLHPLVLFDEAQGETDRAEDLSGRILEVCLAYGGSITGEHGVGHDKKHHMVRMFTERDLYVMQALRCAF